MSRKRKGQHVHKPHKVRAYDGMTKSSGSQLKKTPASFYTHVMVKPVGTYKKVKIRLTLEEYTSTGVVDE